MASPPILPKWPLPAAVLGPATRGEDVDPFDHLEWMQRTHDFLSLLTEYGGLRGIYDAETGSGPVGTPPTASGFGYVRATGRLWLWDGAAWGEAPDRVAAESAAREAAVTGLAADLAARAPLAGSGAPPTAVGVAGPLAPLWLDTQGRLGALGLAPDLVEHALAPMRAPVPDAGAVPMIVSGPYVLSWRGADGAVGFAGAEAAASSPGVSAPAVSSGAVPLATDGRTLWRFRGRLAQARRGEGRLRVAAFGDSWVQSLRINTPLRARLSAALGGPAAAAGWLSARNMSPSSVYPGGSGYVSVGAGWEARLANVSPENPAPTFPLGVGPDGFALYATGAGGAVAYEALDADSLTIYTRAHGGSWRWRLDGGAWTVVAEPSGGALRATAIPGLSGGSHRVEVERVAGSVAILGALADKSAARLLYMALGQGSIAADEMAPYLAALPDFAPSLAPDLLHILFSTNDYRSAASPPSTYLAALGSVVSGLRGANPDLGVVVSVPPLSGGTVVWPQSEYRDAAYEFALSNNCEFLNLTDGFGGYARTSALGLWADSLHLNDAGADALVGMLCDNLLRI